MPDTDSPEVGGSMPTEELEALYAAIGYFTVSFSTIAAAMRQEIAIMHAGRSQMATQALTSELNFQGLAKAWRDVVIWLYGTDRGPSSQPRQRLDQPFENVLMGVFDEIMFVNELRVNISHGDWELFGDDREGVVVVELRSLRITGSKERRRLQLSRGRVGEAIMRQPPVAVIRQYAERCLVTSLAIRLLCGVLSVEPDRKYLPNVLRVAGVGDERKIWVSQDAGATWRCTDPDSPSPPPAAKVLPSK